MSDTDSFINEVTDEVKRDRLYGYMRRYGWIGVLVILLIVGGASFSEWRKSQTEAQAEALGDAMIAALSLNDQAARSSAIAAVEAENPVARAALDMIAASELVAAENIEDAAARLTALAENGDVPEVYRNIAGFKAILIQSETLDIAQRRAGFEGFAVPGNPMRMLAQEQLALIDVEAGDIEAALTRLQASLIDAEATADLQRRAMQVMVALGGEPDLSALQQSQN
ncbi:MAG: hypothetical protein ABJL99_00735 [Aliishimia sp.]